MKKLGSAKKMKLGGSAIKKAPVEMYGIPQENMGTSGQMGFAKKGGTLKKEHPITTFRKANEARQAVVKKSLKKAQDGIEMNDNMINKAGSTGGYKKPLEKYKPWENPTYEKIPSYIKPTREYADPRMDPNYNPNPPASSNFSGPKALSARMAAMKQKKGGSVKYKTGGEAKATKFAALAPPYNKATAADRIAGAKMNNKKMAKGGTTHPGFKAVQSKIAAKQGISKEAAGAILASSARKASAKAKAANPRLKRVKG